jgi:hypothetical protein
MTAKAYAPWLAQAQCFKPTGISGHPHLALWSPSQPVTALGRDQSRFNITPWFSASWDQGARGIKINACLLNTGKNLFQ